MLSIDSAFALFPYYVAGLFCPLLLKRIKAGYILPIAIMGLIVYSIISIRNGGIDYDQMKLGENVWMTYASGLVGCFAITFLFSNFARYRNVLLMDIGMNTLTILGLHCIPIQIFRFSYKAFASNDLPIWYLLALSIMTLLLCYHMSKLFVKYCPVMIGRKIYK